jgi:hypothetical protein
MRQEAREPRAFGKAGAQQLLERDGAEADERGGEGMTMKIATQASVAPNSRKSISTERS